VKVYTPGQNRHVGNESLVVVGVRWHPGKNLPDSKCCFPCNLNLARIPCLGVELSPSSGVIHC
jgi:hypothetical protein